jgi:hypothetical protein
MIVTSVSPAGARLPKLRSPAPVVLASVDPEPQGLSCRPSERVLPKSASSFVLVIELGVKLRNGITVCTENLLRVDDLTESPKLAE